MRIGLIIYGSLDTVSGGYLYDRQLVRHLQQHGDEVEIFSWPWTRYGNHLLHNIDARMSAQLRASALDLLLQDELNHPSLFWLNRRLRQQLDCPIVSIVHHLRNSESHPSLLLPLYRWIESQYLRTVDGFIFNSKTTRAAVADLMQKQKPHVIAYPAADHNPSKVDRALVRKRAHAPGPLRLIFVGNIIPRKGCLFLLRALADLPKESWQLEIVGDLTVDPKHVRQLQIQASASGIAKHIHWHGRLPDADLSRFLTSSQLLVVPSTYEGFGIVYLEGMNHGLPAIATTSGAAHEIITSGVDGFLVPAEDNAALAGHIQTLNDDRSLLARQSLAALDRARNHPPWGKSMASVRQFLVDMIS